MGEGHDGVVVFDPDGKRIGKIVLPERSANLCFGGLKRNRLFMAASHSLYSLYVNTRRAWGLRPSRTETCRDCDNSRPNRVISVMSAQ